MTFNPPKIFPLELAIYIWSEEASSSDSNHQTLKIRVAVKKQNTWVHTFHETVIGYACTTVWTCMSNAWSALCLVYYVYI